MIPYSYSMVNMEGIDLAEANHTVVPGIYEKLTDAMNACGDMVLYNWFFCGIPIQPEHLTALQTSDGILINGLIQVTELDEISVLGIAPPPPPIVPVEPITITENGVYTAVEPFSGFNPVTVHIQQDVIISDEPPSPDVGNVGQYYIYAETVVPDTIGITLTKAARGSDYNFTYWGTNGIVFFFEDAEGNEVASNEMSGVSAYWAIAGSVFQQRDQVLNYSSSYSERNGLNGYFKFVFPSQLVGYKVKKIRIWARQNTSYHDFWRTFSIATWLSDRVDAQVIVSKEDLVESDWSFTTYTDIDFQVPVELFGRTVYSLYQKTAQGWVLLT